MKNLPLRAAFGVVFLLAPLRAAWQLEPAVQARVGYDTNARAAGGSAVAVLGESDSATAAAGLTLALVAPPAPGAASGRITYAAEVVRFENLSGEDFSTHRLTAAGQLEAAGWRCSGEASALDVVGSRDTLASLAGCNANAISLWRERRAQWQERAKFLAQRAAGALRLRISGATLVYDYRTRAVAGHVPFADRSDFVGGADLGWQASASSLWLVGARVGAQRQAMVPLPGGSFNYSNRYSRLVAGWEGALPGHTTVALLAGPDFRDYTGHVDPTVFPSRHHSFGWFEASATTKLSPSCTLALKSTRWAWLSSTGKSAYTDFATELSLGWDLTSALTVRAAVKAHQCAYFPALRDDWESLSSLALIWKVGAQCQLSAEVLQHRGWNELAASADRAFERSVVTLGASRRW